MKPKTVTSFCPGHISGYFKRIEGDTIASSGSIGAGIVISSGVLVTVSADETTSISIRQKNICGSSCEIAKKSPPLEYILARLNLTAAIITECQLPIGAGFGLSAAALLATLTALNQLCNLDLTPHSIALYAHESEVIHQTGLGDVAASQGGGRVLRMGPGVDGRIERIFDLTEPLYALSFGPIPTPSVIGSPDQIKRISSAFPTSPPRDLNDFFRISRVFAGTSGLVTPEVREVLERCSDDDVPASMTMLGNGVFAYGRSARTILREFGDVFEFGMAQSGTCIIEEKP
jgi:pantoate kinase